VRSLRVFICIAILISLVAMQPSSCNAVVEKPLEDSKELQLQDMLVLLLLPQMREKLADIYSDILSISGSPDIYPYFVDVKHIDRVNGFRGFNLLITLIARPTVGPHIPVGEDVFKYRISSAGVKLESFEHLRGPNKEDFP
jgi:hypothetical protein